MDIVVPNWDGIENAVMKGYIYYAIDDWNANNPEDKIDLGEMAKLLRSLRWATDMLTAQEAYDYYMKK